MTCTQNHKNPEECVRSDCAPVNMTMIGNKCLCGTQYFLNCPIHCKACGKTYAECQDYLPYIPKTEPKQRMTPDETFIQWLKIVGLSIALGVMVYQTYLLKIISGK